MALVRLRGMLYLGVRPALRQCGFAPEIVQELANERLIRVADTVLVIERTPNPGGGVMEDKGKGEMTRIKKNAAPQTTSSGGSTLC